MDLDSIVILLALILGAIVVLPIVALVRTARIRQVERRLEGVEAALRRVMAEIASLRDTQRPAGPVEEAERVSSPSGGMRQPQRPAEEEAAPASERPAVPTAPVSPAAPPASPTPTPSPPGQVRAAPRALEEVIGQSWLGWIAAVLILFAAAFFLKYAFENRWIGEVGRVMIGVVVGLVFVWAGWRRHLAGWRYFAQVLTACGITLVYLSTYASFGFYQVIDQTSAFVFLVLVVVQGHLLALAYGSPAIALMSQIGGFLVPLLLSTGQDRYPVLFTYVVILNIGVVLLSFARRWSWIASFSFCFTHVLFWAWHASHYHPEKRPAALAFHAVVFALFLLADLAPQRRGRKPAAEQWGRLFVNPFVFFASAYHLLKEAYPDWMGAFALVMALLYAALARAGIARHEWDRRTILVAIGVALTFVTLAIPIQLQAHWITLGWAAQGAILVWLSTKTDAPQLRVFAGIVFGIALFHHLASDTAWYGRPMFTPVWNRYFLSALALAALLMFAASMARQASRGFAAIAVLAALGLLWLATSVETYTYSDALEAALPPERTQDQVRQIRWFGQSILSVLWSLYAAALVGAGFRWEWPLLRWAGLSLFGLALLKVVLIDMSQLEQFYRIVAFLALGLVLLGVAWTYQRITRRERAG